MLLIVPLFARSLRHAIYDVEFRHFVTPSGLCLCLDLAVSYQLCAHVPLGSMCVYVCVRACVSGPSQDIHVLCVSLCPHLLSACNVTCSFLQGPSLMTSLHPESICKASLSKYYHSYQILEVTMWTLCWVGRGDTMQPPKPPSPDLFHPCHGALVTFLQRSPPHWTVPTATCFGIPDLKLKSPACR